MTNKQLLDKMVEDGAAIGVSSPRFLPPMAIAVAEILPNDRVFWVQLGAEDQHHIHSVPFDAVEQTYNGLGIKFIQNGNMIAYVTPFAEWPQLNTDDLMEEIARWKQELKDDGRRRAFEKFVNRQRRIHSR